MSANLSAVTPFFFRIRPINSGSNQGNKLQHGVGEDRFRLDLQSTKQRTPKKFATVMMTRFGRNKRTFQSTAGGGRRIRQCTFVGIAVAITVLTLQQLPLPTTTTRLLIRVLDNSNCTKEELRPFVTSQRLTPAAYDAASLSDLYSLAQAEFYLRNPFWTTYPAVLAACQRSLPVVDRVIKQLYLEDYLPPLQTPEQILPGILGTTGVSSANIIDIGANVGQFGLPLARAGHTVYSFEPVDSTCQTLRDNLRKAQESKQQQQQQNLQHAHCLCRNRRQTPYPTLWLFGRHTGTVGVVQDCGSPDRPPRARHGDRCHGTH